MDRTLAWPLILVGLAVVAFQFGVMVAVWQTFRRPVPLMASRAFLIGVPCFEVLVDVLLGAWIARAITRGRDHSRQTGLFFLWQGVKMSFTFFCVAFQYGYFPFPHWL
jgi:hypothetical protein